MIREAIFKLVDKKDLSFDEAYAVVNEIMSGETTPVQTAAFLAALSTKSTRSETIEEIAGCAEGMRAHATRITYPHPTLEIVGTGGDCAESFNISTTAAFVIAAGGIKVAKHGNRAASSKSGAADCQEALGANINQNPAVATKMLDEVGMCFLFAQHYHTAMKHVGPIRKELGIRTVFNILGPLTNPASPQYMVMGVYDASLVEPLAHVLHTLGVQHGVVVFGVAGLDELSSACDTLVCEINHGSYHTYTLHPEDFGMKRCTRDDLQGGDAKENAATLQAILDGKERGCKRDTVVLNAGAGLYVGGIAPSLQAGVVQACKLIDSGAARHTLDAYVEASTRLTSEADGD